MIDYTLRAARADDAAVIRSMIRAERLDPTNVHWANFLVAQTADGRVAACGQIKPYRGARELGSLVVLKEYRRSGLGAALINALIEREQARGQTVLFLFCLAFREPYYGKFGFVRVGLRDLPLSLKMKYALGTFFTRLARYRLIAMRRG